MIPLGTPTYDWVTTMPRSIYQIYLAETDIDNTPGDSLGTDTSTYPYNGSRYFNSITHAERNYFEHAAATPGWPGMKNVTIGSKTYPAAHYLIDYLKIWDMPADAKITPFPH
jgi:hypothetical protein